MENPVVDDLAEISRLCKDLRNLEEQKDYYRSRQMAMFQERQEKDIKEVEELKARMRAEQEKLQEQANELREGVELQIQIMATNLDKQHVVLNEKLGKLQESIDRDEREVKERIEENDILMEEKSKRVKNKLHESSKRLVVGLGASGGSPVASEEVDNDDMLDSSLTPTAASPDAPAVFHARHKRMASSQTVTELEGARKRLRHDSPVIPEAQVQEVVDTRGETQQRTPVSPRKEPPLPTPDSAQSAVQKPKGLIVAPWQRDRLVNYADIRGKEYIYVRHNVPRVLRCLDCPGFAVWPTRPIKDEDKAHFANSELHREQRARDKDAKPGRGRNSADGISGDWITRNFGWRVVNGVPKGSLEEWAANHNDEVDRRRKGKVVSDIVFPPPENEIIVVEDWPEGDDPTGFGRSRARSGRSRSSFSGLEPITPVTTRQSESETPDRGFDGSPESVSRAAAREGGYSMRSIARRNYTIPGVDDITDKA